VTARLKEVQKTVAKVTPGEFIRQVRSEASKVVWPTRRETLMTAVMVLIMTSLLAIFFLGVDSVFSTIVQFLLRQIA
jgi:preprotein translocase subunit SecE